MTYGRLERFDHSSLRIVLFAGEIFPIEALKKLQQLWPQATFYNLYGPTETNVVTWFQVPKTIARTYNSPLPIGKSCSHVSCKIWNEKILDLQPGIQGELIVSGVSVTPGYLNLPEINKRSFLKDQQGKIWYRTGDLVKVNHDLEFEFIGRKDRMVKRHGYRIELDEIEAILHRYSGLKEVGVISITEENNILIKAFISKSLENTRLTIPEIKTYFLNYLPLYMLPDQFIFVDHLPKTSTHKINYQQLARL